jgi:nitrite reductase/ring-hydroxylating ferredoxin subunit
MSRHVIAKVGEIAPGQRKILEVGGRRIGVFHSNGEYFALLDRCPHQGASLCSGMLLSLVDSSGPGEYRTSRQAEMLRCPWHGWEFDIRTGQSWCDPSKLRVKTYPVTVEPGAELAKGPYVATTYSVTVEDDYVLVDI